MNLLNWAYVVAATVCGTVAVQHLMVAARLRERRIYVLFALTALAAAVDALVNRGYLSVQTAADAERYLAWSAVSICSFLVLFVWFVALRTGVARPWLLWTATGLLVATALIDFVLPTGSPAFVRVDGVHDVVMPWGEVVRMIDGTPSPWRIVGDLANVAFLVFLFDTTVQLVRRSRRREVLLAGGSLVAIGFSVLAIIPMDLGLVELPTLHSFAFLLIVAGASWDLSDRVVKAGEFSREIARGESRWRQLVENAPLLLVVVNRDGRIASVNPHYEKVTERKRDDVVGRPVHEFVPESDRGQVEAAFHRAISGEATDGYEGEILVASGERKVVAWRSVLLRDGHGAPEAILSLGADVTTRRHAERARDEALRDLKRSVRDLDNLRQRLEEENLVLREAVGQEGTHPSMVGSSPALMYVIHKVRHVAPTGASVLLTGETGVGKELVARMIHRESARASGPFVAVNCAALPANLVESELFGHERGAFTGADRMRRGRFEVASGGTLFLDEIAQLPLELQPKLLRALQEGQIERVGADRTLSVDVRVIAASNLDLREEVDAGRFRQDLFYRLDVYPITIPPLRERLEDIPALVEHFVRQVSAREGIRVDQIPPEVLRHLAKHVWPGNVRELQNVIERAVVRCSDGVLRLVEPLVKRPERSSSPDGQADSLRPTLDELQRDYIREVLQECNGRVAGAGGAAEVLGLHPNTLRSRMHKLRIPAAGAPRASRSADLEH